MEGGNDICVLLGWIVLPSHSMRVTMLSSVVLTVFGLQAALAFYCDVPQSSPTSCDTQVTPGGPTLAWDLGPQPSTVMPTWVTLSFDGPRTVCRFNVRRIKTTAQGDYLNAIYFTFSNGQFVAVSLFDLDLGGSGELLESLVTQGVTISMTDWPGNIRQKAPSSGTIIAPNLEYDITFLSETDSPGLAVVENVQCQFAGAINCRELTDGDLTTAFSVGVGSQYTVSLTLPTPQSVAGLAFLEATPPGENSRYQGLTVQIGSQVLPFTLCEIRDSDQGRVWQHLTFPAQTTSSVTITFSQPLYNSNTVVFGFNEIEVYKPDGFGPIEESRLCSDNQYARSSYTVVPSSFPVTSPFTTSTSPRTSPISSTTTPTQRSSYPSTISTTTTPTVLPPTGGSSSVYPPAATSKSTDNWVIVTPAPDTSIRTAQYVIIALLAVVIFILLTGLLVLCCRRQTKPSGLVQARYQPNSLGYSGQTSHGNIGPIYVIPKAPVQPGGGVVTVHKV